MTNDIQVIFTPAFAYSLKQLEKKYPKAYDDLLPVIDQLESGDTPGDQVPGVRYTVYKVRVPNRSARRGKRGGFRLIYYLQTQKQILLLVIYSKTKRQDISPDQIRRIIEDYEQNAD